VSAADCMINSITAYTDTNTCEGEIIDIVFDIDAVDFGLNGFTVSDGFATETFDLNDNFTFTTISLCDEDLELTFTDLDDPSCNEIITITPDCCECIVDDLFVNPTACVNGTFDAYLDMFIESGSCISYDWTMEIEGVDYDLVFNGSSLVASDITATDSVIVAIVCTLAPSGECFTVEFENPCFVSASDCMINSFTANYLTSSCVGEIIQIEFDFDATNFGANGFTIEADGDVTSFNLGDPYMIYVITLCNEDIEVILTDIDDPNCTATVVLGPACCDCEISDPMIETSDCENDLFNIFIDFFDNEGTCVNYDWFLTIDGEDYDLEWNSTTQQYEALDINNTADSLVTVLLCNDSPLQECFTYVIENPCFESNSGTDCIISSFTADYNVGSCDGEIIMIDFEYVAMDFGVNGFTVEANGEVTSFNLGDPYQIYMITLCNEDIELVLTDNDDPDCTASLTLGPACCDCEISDPVLEASDCDNGLFDLHVEFDVLEGTCINYDWFVTIEGTDYSLDFNNGGFYEATNIQALDSLLTIILCNESPLNECTTYIIENPCFESTSNSDCMITSFTAEYNSGSCNGEIIMIDFDFDATDFGVNGFTVSAGGDTANFNLGDPYMIYLITLCDEDIEVVITDNDDPDCTETIVLGPACCDCEITDPVFTTTDCEEDLFDISIDFLTNEGTCVNYDWFITINGEDYDLEWNSSTQESEAFEIVTSTMDSLITILLCNDSPLQECFTYTIENPCFDSMGNVNSTVPTLLEEIIFNKDLAGNILLNNISTLKVEYKLWSINGIETFSGSINATSIKSIYTSDVPKGIYLLRLKNQKGVISIKKLVLIN